MTVWLEISNPHRRMEVFVPELVDPVLLGQADPTGLQVTTRIEARHPDEESRPDGYWAAYIVKGRRQHPRPRQHHRQWSRCLVDRRQPLGGCSLGELRALRPTFPTAGVLVPLRWPDPLSSEQADFVAGDRCQVPPLRTHLLGPSMGRLPCCAVMPQIWLSPVM